MECVNDSEGHNPVVLTQDRGKGKRWHRLQKKGEGRESNLTQWIMEGCRPQLPECFIKGFEPGELQGEQVKTPTLMIKEIQEETNNHSEGVVVVSLTQKHT